MKNDKQSPVPLEALEHKHTHTRAPARAGEARRKRLHKYRPQRARVCACVQQKPCFTFPAFHDSVSLQAGCAEHPEAGMSVWRFEVVRVSASCCSAALRRARRPN